MSAVVTGRSGLVARQSPKLSTLAAPGRANAACYRLVRTRRLQIEACHRCLARHLVPPLQVQRGGSGTGSTARSPAAVAALRDAQHQQATTAEDKTLFNQQEQQGGAGPRREQAAAQPPAPAEQQGQDEQQSAGVAAALAMLRFYKSAISPLLPPACRFLPTCSGQWPLPAGSRNMVPASRVTAALRLLGLPSARSWRDITLYEVVSRPRGQTCCTPAAPLPQCMRWKHTSALGWAGAPC